MIDELIHSIVLHSPFIAAMVVLASAAFEDQKTGWVSDVYPAMMLTFGIIFNFPIFPFIPLYVLALGTLDNLKEKGAFKWGDWLLIAGIAALFPNLSFVALVFGLAVGLATWANGKKKVRFVPYLFAAFIIVYPFLKDLQTIG